mmetsp:Transcript_26218/g.61695  ORF Transcript_26218/g.61695 Transcript_26218/m.61695 type:complete len:97 (-) Transcript_26218:87-377(-)
MRECRECDVSCFQSSSVIKLLELCFFCVSNDHSKYSSIQHLLSLNGLREHRQRIVLDCFARRNLYFSVLDGSDSRFCLVSSSGTGFRKLDADRTPR